MQEFVGRQEKREWTVTKEMLAVQMGSGMVPVLATPALIACMENACMRLVQPAFGEGITTVGTRVEVAHLAPDPRRGPDPGDGHPSRHRRAALYLPGGGQRRKRQNRRGVDGTAECAAVLLRGKGGGTEAVLMRGRFPHKPVDRQEKLWYTDGCRMFRAAAVCAAGRGLSPARAQRVLRKGRFPYVRHY